MYRNISWIIFFSSIIWIHAALCGATKGFETMHSYLVWWYHSYFLIITLPFFMYSYSVMCFLQVCDILTLFTLVLCMLAHWHDFMGRLSGTELIDIVSSTHMLLLPSKVSHWKKRIVRIVILRYLFKHQLDNNISMCFNKSCCLNFN